MTTETRSITPEELTDIITETVLETEKDARKLLKLVHLVTSTALQVMEALQKDGTPIAPRTARGLKDGTLTWKVLKKLGRHSQSFELSHDELAYCLTRWAPEGTLEAQFDDVEPVIEALKAKGMLNERRELTEGARRHAGMFDTFLTILKIGGGLPDSVTLGF